MLPSDSDVGGAQVTLRKTLVVMTRRKEMINPRLETTSTSFYTHYLPLIAFSFFSLSPSSLYLYILILSSSSNATSPGKPSLTLWTVSASGTSAHLVIVHINLVTI